MAKNGESNIVLFIVTDDLSLKWLRSGIGTKSMQNTSAYEEPRSSGKRLHKYWGLRLTLCHYCKMSMWLKWNGFTDKNLIIDLHLRLLCLKFKVTSLQNYEYFDL